MIINLSNTDFERNDTLESNLNVSTHSNHISFSNHKEIIQLKNEIKSKGVLINHLRFAVLTDFRILIYADKNTFLKKKKPKNNFNLFEHDFEVEGKIFKIIRNKITLKNYFFSSVEIAIFWWESINKIKFGEKINISGSQVIVYDSMMDTTNNMNISTIQKENIKNITEIDEENIINNITEKTIKNKTNSNGNIINKDVLTEKSYQYDNQSNGNIVHNIINETIINEYIIRKKRKKDSSQSCILNNDENNDMRKSILNGNVNEIHNKSLYTNKNYRGKNYI